jgi:hypothetical protein
MVLGRQIRIAATVSQDTTTKRNTTYHGFPKDDYQPEFLKTVHPNASGILVENLEPVRTYYNMTGQFQI